MKYLHIIFIPLLLLTFSCQNHTDTSDYRQYVIIRFDRQYVNSLDDVVPIVTINDGSYTHHDNAPNLTYSNGNELKFKSTVGVINYMVSQGWKFEGITTTHLLELDTEDASLLFSKPISKVELDNIVNKSYR